MQNKVVLHFMDGTIRKGMTSDFSPNKPTFHYQDNDTGKNTPVEISALKAVFFVKDFAGNKDYKERQDGERAGLGKKIQVCFKDKETVIGYTSGFAPNRPGFFVVPVDPMSNNERIFVVVKSTDKIQFI